MSEKQSAYSEDVQEVQTEESTGQSKGSVKKLNKKVAYAGVGGLTLMTVLLLVIQSWTAQSNLDDREEAARLAGQEKPVQVDTQGAQKEAESLFDAQARKRQEEADQADQNQAQSEQSQALQALKDPVDPVQQAQSIAAFHDATHASSSPPDKGEKKSEDPWVRARKAFREQDAQIHYQQRMAARSTPIFGGGGSPSDDGATQAPDAMQPVHPAQSQAELAAQLQAIQSRPAGAPQDAMMTYTQPQGSQGAQGIKMASLPAGDAHQEAFHHQGGRIQAGYEARPSQGGRVNVQAGTVVHLALETGISSELPGVLMARVTQPVYDPSLSHVAIPSGTKVIGVYNARVEKGQTRVQVSWTTLVWDGGGSYDLGGLPGVDLGGQSGLEADVDNHFDKAFAGAALSGILSASASALAGPTNQLNVDPRQQAINGAAQPFQESGEVLSKQYLDLAPTLSLEPGAVVGMLVPHDLSF
jgi:type IV secretory pathway VirB10-like protein